MEGMRRGGKVLAYGGYERQAREEVPFNPKGERRVPRFGGGRE